MNHINSVQRTAPIPIAPKPPRIETATQRQDSLRRFEIGSGSLHARAPTDSASAPASSAPINGQSVPPCQACQYSGTRCILSEDDETCMPCQVNATECSLSSSTSSPQSRKRRINGTDTPLEMIGKRRLVFALVKSEPSPPFPLTLARIHPVLSCPALFCFALCVPSCPALLLISSAVVLFPPLRNHVRLFYLHPPKPFANPSRQILYLL
jgi:hypothetical protein